MRLRCAVVKRKATPATMVFLTLACALAIAGIALAGCVNQNQAQGQSPPILTSVNSTPLAPGGSPIPTRQMSSPRPTMPPPETVLQNGQMEMRITPSNESSIEGTVKFEVVKTPRGTKFMSFAIQPRRSSNTSAEAEFFSLDLDGREGWARELDSTDYADGRYIIYAFALSEAKQGTPPLAVIQGDFLIRNNPSG